VFKRGAVPVNTVVKLEAWKSVVDTAMAKLRRSSNDGSPPVAAGFRQTRSIVYVPLFASSTMTCWFVTSPSVDQPEEAEPSIKWDTSQTPP